MRKRLTVWIVLTGLLSLSAAEWLDAQPPNASTKFRGDFGRPSMRSTPPRTVRNVQVPAVASASDAAIESYSLEPLPFGVGDTVTVVRDRANLLRGKRVVGSVGEGSELRVLKIRGVCDSHGVPLPAAALQFCLAHPVVDTVIPGARTRRELLQALEWMETAIPDALWEDLKREGLLAAAAPTMKTRSS